MFYRGTYNFNDIQTLGVENLEIIKNNQNKINPDSACNIQFTSVRYLLLPQQH